MSVLSFHRRRAAGPPVGDAARRAAAVAAALLLVAAPAGAEQGATEVSASSRVEAATLYPDGASVTRTASFAAEAGQNEIVISDMPLRLHQATLRVGGVGDAPYTIEGVTFRLDRPGLEPLPDAERERIEAEIAVVEAQIRERSDVLASAEARVKHVAEFRRGLASADRDGALLDDPLRWADAWRVLADEEAAARALVRQAEFEIDQLDEERAALRRELANEGEPPAPRGVLRVEISAAAPVAEGELEITYLTDDASWAPAYDLRLDRVGDSAERALTVTRRASVRQSTGENWNQVRLTLSTARPSGAVGVEPPRPIRAFLSRPVPAPMAMAPPREAQQGSLYGGQTAGELLTDAAPRAETDRERVPAQEQAMATAVIGDMVSFEIPRLVDVEGDGEVRQTLIGSQTERVTPSLRATPALDDAAYMYVEFENGEAPILPGRASVYRDGAFLGQRTLAYVSPGATAELAFGRYDPVRVSHHLKSRSEGQEGVFTTSNQLEVRYEMTAENTGDETMRLTLYAARPFTETEQITVDEVFGTPASERDVNAARGVMGWTFVLQGGDDRTIAYGFDLTWPKDEELVLR